MSYNFFSILYHKTEKYLSQYSCRLNIDLLFIAFHGFQFLHHLFGNSMDLLAMPISIIWVLKDLRAHVTLGSNLRHVLQLVVCVCRLLCFETTTTYQANGSAIGAI